MRQETFDLEEGLRLKKEGMAEAEDNPSREDLLDLARKVAITLAQRYGEITADTVGRFLRENNGVSSLGPAAGSIFKAKIWEFTGKRKKSARIKNHGRELKVWRLKEGWQDES
jgi:hypothetical protein